MNSIAVFPSQYQFYKSHHFIKSIFIFLFVISTLLCSVIHFYLSPGEVLKKSKSMRFLFTKSSKEIKLKGYSQINSFNIDTNLCNNIFRKNDTKIYLKHKAFLNLKLLESSVNLNLNYKCDIENADCLLKIKFTANIKHKNEEIFDDIIRLLDEKNEKENVYHYQPTKEVNKDLIIQGKLHIDNNDKSQGIYSIAELKLKRDSDNYNIIIGEINGDAFSLNTKFYLEMINESESTITLYSVLFCAITLFSSISQLYFSSRINSNKVYSQSFCLFSLAYNIFYSGYSIYANILIFDSNINYMFTFLILITFLLFHLLCDLRIWVVVQFARQIKKTTILVLTILVFFACIGSITIGLNIYCDSSFAYAHVMLLWFPQIVHTAIKRTVYTIPRLYILIQSMYKLFPIFFFCFYDTNFDSFKKMKMFCIILLLVVFIIIVLLRQIDNDERIKEFFRFFKIENKLSKLYRSKKEIIEEYPDVIIMQCAICLNDLINKNELKTELSKESIIKPKKKMFISFIRKFVSFNKKVKNTQEKCYIITKCCHLFHSACLEDWIELKNECPNCRRPINY